MTRFSRSLCARLPRPAITLVHGLLDLLHPDGLLAPAGREQRGLVDDVREVGAGEAGRAPRDDSSTPRFFGPDGSTATS